MDIYLLEDFIIDIYELINEKNSLQIYEISNNIEIYLKGIYERLNLESV